MKKKVFNLQMIIGMSFWAVATVGCVISFLAEKYSAENMLYAFIVLSVLFVAFLFDPISVEFDKESLTIHFLFGFFQKLDWETVWKIERQGVPADIRYYRVFGEAYGKSAFFTSSKIPCNQKTKRLLREYWNKNF